MLHAAVHETTVLVENVGEQDELLRVEDGSGDVVQKLGALNGNAHAADLVFLGPELLQLFL